MNDSTEYITPTYVRGRRIAGKAGDTEGMMSSPEAAILPDPSSYGIFPGMYDDRTSGQSLSTWRG